MASSFVSGTLDTRERFKVPLVVVADSSGALEALLRGIVAMKDEDDAGVCVPDVVSSSVGQVTSGDVAIAVTTAATIVAYRAPLPSGIENEAKQANIPVIANEVVYSVLDDIKELVRKKLNPMPPGIFIGRAEVLKLFKFKTTTIAGCRLLEGSITKEASIRVLRGKRNVVFTGRAASLRLVKEVVDEVVGGAGMEFGLSCDTDFSGFEEGDIIECFKPTAATVPTTTTTTTKVEDYNAMPIDHA
jgi:translation initiation factor IF-2